MRALLDTHTFLWWITDDARLSALGRQVIAAAENEIYLSAASVWEMTIKVGKGRLILPAPPAEFIASRMLQSRFRPLPVQISHAAHVYDLPAFHSDPFDRLLIAQSQLERLPLITQDEQICRYELETIW